MQARATTSSTKPARSARTRSARAEANRALALRWFGEVWNDRKAGTIDEIMDAGCVGHMEGTDGPVDPAAFREANAALLAAFPDLSVEVVNTVAEGDQVVVQWRLRASHTGPGLGIPPTGRSVDSYGTTWFTFENGRIVAGRDSWNQGALIARLTAP